MAQVGRVCSGVGSGRCEVPSTVDMSGLSLMLGSEGAEVLTSLQPAGLTAQFKEGGTAMVTTDHQKYLTRRHR